MMLQLVRYNETMEADELAFLQRRELQDRTQLMRVVRVILVVCFICPFGISWGRAIAGVPNPFSYLHYFLGVLFLICFSAFILYISYYKDLRKMQSDLHHQTKTVEQTQITRKQYMPQNNMHYFYLASPTKLSIEVSANDYSAMELGDEVNIEYTTHAKLYLGYF